MSPQTQSHARAGGAMRRALTLACTGWANRGGALASATRGVGNPRMPGANAPTPGRVAAAIRRLLQRRERHPDRRCKWRNASCTTCLRLPIVPLPSIFRSCGARYHRTNCRCHLGTLVTLLQQGAAETQSPREVGRWGSCGRVVRRFGRRCAGTLGERMCDMC